MNQFSSRDRKFIYMSGILVLLVPIAWLGMPATQKADSGGKIAELRRAYKLGEATLGDVDPTSATMNLVLLGMRGIAASVLWTQADEQKRTKNWSELESTVESIIKLQPRFLQVWNFQGWNLAYNVSVECDAVEDRYFWVKKGGKFMQRGMRQNEGTSELPYYAGNIFGKKIGLADERKQFRKFFISDPDPRFGGLADDEINPEGKDNYLVAKDLYLDANENEEAGAEQHVMARSLFRAYPYRSQMDYAAALESEGLFNEVAREAWLKGNNEWRAIYGRQKFTTPAGDIEFEATREEIIQMAENEGIDPLEKLEWQQRYHKMTNYPYWRTRSEVESKREMTDARRALHEGKEKFFASDLEDTPGPDGQINKGARSLFEEGLTKLESLLVQYPTLIMEDELVEDVLKSLLMWHYVLRLVGQEVPADFPLKAIWDAYPEDRAELDAAFQRKVNSAF